MKKVGMIGILAAGLMLMAQSVNILVHVGTKDIAVNLIPTSTVTFSVDNQVAVASGNATVNLSVATTRRPATGIQFDIVASATIDSVVATAGPVSVAAGKSIACNTLNPTTTRCLISGINLNFIGNGIAANIAVHATDDGTISLQNVVASSKESTPLKVAIGTGGGAVTVSIVQTAANCVAATYDTGAPAGTVNIESGEQLACTTTINKAAKAGGLVIPLTTSVPGLVVPASVTVPAGATSVAFTVAGQ